jgi:hypothetical protein
VPQSQRRVLDTQRSAEAYREMVWKHRHSGFLRHLLNHLTRAPEGWSWRSQEEARWQVPTDWAKQSVGATSQFDHEAGAIMRQFLEHPPLAGDRGELRSYPRRRGG